jgi:putative membrane protein
VPVGFPAWHANPDVWTLMGALEGIYLWAARRENALDWRRAAYFTAGVLSLWLASDWPIDTLGDYLFCIHMVEHLVFLLVAPPLLWLGTPEPVARTMLARTRLIRPVQWIGRPIPALIQFNAVMALIHWPALVNATLEYESFHFFIHVLMLASGLVMWLPVVSPLSEIPQLRPPAKMLYLFLQTILPTVPASFLTFGTTPLYRYYEHVPRVFGLSALTDMQIAGLVMKLGGGFFLWTVIGVIFFRWNSSEERSEGELTWEQIAPALASSAAQSHREE